MQDFLTWVVGLGAAGFAASVELFVIYGALGLNWPWPSRRRWIRIVGIGISVGLFGLAFTAIDPLGFYSTLRGASADIYDRVVAPWYPFGLLGTDGSGRGRDAIRVFYIDDRALDILGKYAGWRGWPPDFDQQAVMLADLTRTPPLDDAGPRQGPQVAGPRPPRALFVDLLMVKPAAKPAEYQTYLNTLEDITHAAQWRDKPGCRDEPLVKIACILKAGGVPVIIAAPPPPARGQALSPFQQALAKVAVMTPVLVKEGAYATRFAPDDPAVAGASGGEALSPAAALYAAYCMAGRSGCERAFKPALEAAEAASGGALPKPPRWPANLDAPIAVEWGSRPDPQQAALVRAATGQDPACHGEPPGDVRTLLVRLGRELLPARRDERGELEVCPYAFAFSYARLAVGFGLEPPNMRELLDDKIVILGAQLGASNDYVAAPPQGQLPGVYLHAMALDNLIERGPSYRHGAVEGRGVRPGPDEVIESTLEGVLEVIVLLGLALREPGPPDPRTGEPRRAVPASAVLGAVFAAWLVIVAGCLWLANAVAHLAPFNWIAVLGVAGGAVLVIVRKFILQDIKGALGAAARWIDREHYEEEAAEARAGRAEAGREGPRADGPPAARPSARLILSRFVVRYVDGTPRAVAGETEIIEAASADDSNEEEATT